MSFAGGSLEEKRARRRRRKGMFLLPSLFTIANMAAGFYAITHATQAAMSTDPRAAASNFDLAAKAIGVAVFFDGMDGAIARLTNTTSDFGRELDSLADVVTFGVAPALLAWLWGIHQLPLVLSQTILEPLGRVGVIASFVFLAAGAARLARFNIQANPQPSNPGRPGRKYFVGMPIPAGAGCIAAVVHFRGGAPVQVWWTAVAWILFIMVLAFLMVSRWRFWSAKSLDFRSGHPFRLVVIIGLMIYAIVNYSRYVLLAMAGAYLVSGVLARVVYSLERRAEVQPPPQAASGAS